MYMVEWGEFVRSKFGEGGWVCERGWGGPAGSRSGYTELQQLDGLQMGNLQNVNRNE